MILHPSRLALLLMLALPAVAAGRSGIELDHFDPSVRIQDNLFQAVNGKWIKQAEIPADESSWGTFDELYELSQKRVREIVEAAVVHPDSPETRQMAALYQSFMDEALADRLGMAPIKPLLAEIDGITDRKGLTRLLGRLPAQGMEGPLRPYVNVDDNAPSQYVVMVDQHGLGMPDRDYYLKHDASYKSTRASYLNYLEALLRQAGLADPARRAKAVLALETRLAKSQWDGTALRDPHKSHNKFDRAGLTKAAPKFDWAAFLDGAEMSEVQVVDVRTPSYAKVVGQLVASEPLEVWRDYLRLRVLDGTAHLLSKPLAEARFNFHGKALSGMSQMSPRWKRAVSMVNNSLGESVGKQYVAKYFPAEAKARMETLAGNLLKAYQQSLDNVDWLSPDTKAAARDKLSKYRVKVGYPSRWRDYSGLDIRANDLVGNVLRTNRFNYRYKLTFLGKPVDRDEWGMTPQTVNAYYDAPLNEIVFPAAMLQPPFFKADADDAVNYGAIGTIIAHEISHGFDDLGSQYDGDGNMRNWWRPVDRKSFDKLADRLVAQYSRYEALPKHFVNGRLTVGENIADLSGLQIAFKAYQLSLNGKPSATLDGFTGEQRVFIGFGQIWRGKIREQERLRRLTADSHAPDDFRALGPAMNSSAFHQAFNTQPGDGMFKPEADRIRIW
ncbi:M13 family metallopeptidase [Chitinimonas viridis]|uniref:M13 family metallopeptidase n=1 Tax=Chitinimonas viridis TaxID=664880 RepID=A0ABT8BA97_9NEIS|nr:M13 family metallopeptidase [Chitinimonas viridis]MDN3579174.1 M13 family metallopeptidase [Chitinimonas viridis]